MGLTILVALLIMGCTKREDLIVAKVGDRIITVQDFEDASLKMEEKYLPTTNDLDGKKQLLKWIINKEIMSLKAQVAGYEKDEWFVGFWNRYKNPFLVAAMMDKLVRQKVKVTEEEVKKYYDKMHYEYSISQIVVPSEEDAIEIRRKLLNGADFAEMAKRYSMGANAQDGGYVGDAPIGKLFWWVEEALFDMKEGDISEPLRTSEGYAIIKVHRIKRIIPENDIEYARKRVRAIKEKKGIEELKAKIEKEIHLKFYPNAVDIAYNSLPPDIPFKDIVSYKVTRENAPKLVIPDKYRDMIIAQYDDGMVTLADFEELYNSLPLPERPRRQYGKENVIQVVHKSIFDKILPVYAEQKVHILDDPEIKENLEKRKEQFLVYKFYQDQVKDRVGITERELEAYYNEHLGELSEPEERNFAIALLDNQNDARKVAMLARKGQEFSALVRKFSIDEKARENGGQTGFVTRGKYPELDDVVFSLKEGEVSDPIKTSRGWVVVKVIEVKEGKVPRFEEVALKIKKKILEQKSEELLNKKLEEWKKDYKIEIFENNLKKAKLLRVRTASS